MKFYADKTKLLKEVEEKLGVDATPLKKHFDRSELIYKATSKTFRTIVTQTVELPVERYFEYHCAHSLVEHLYDHASSQ